MTRTWPIRRAGLWMALSLAALLMLAALAVLPTMAQAAPPSLSVSPTSGVVGQQVALFGSGYTPGPATIRWDSADAAQVNIPPLTSFTLPFTIPLDTSFGPHTITLCSGNCTTQSASTAFRVDLRLVDMPLDLRRRAQQFLEEMRAGPMAPGWDRAILGTIVRPLYRPDLKNPAYYEFLIQVAPGAQASPNAVAPPRHGFMILASGEHDSPIAHWNYIGNSPTQDLEIQAAVAQKPLIAKFYKLDTLAYAGEDSQGDRVAYLGDEMTRISGQDPAWLDQPVTLSEQNWKPDTQTANDSTTPVSGTLTNTGPKPTTTLQLSAWQSWSEMKAGYAQSYAVQLESQRRLASADWQVENHARQIGEALRKGHIYTYALLSSDVPTTTLSGTGVPMVQTEVLTRTGLPALLQISVINSIPLRDLPLNVDVRYTDGTTETMKFVVIEPASTFVYLPIVLNGAGSQSRQSESQAIRVQGDWGPWTYYWAGTGTDQRLYSQIPSGTAPNNSSCWSGCGGTAWAMLFGWGDNQAAIGNTYWAPRNGLYRQGGGYGADAVAPPTMDAGVRAMTWEIRNRIGTFCAFGSGATAPWSMGNASGYLAGRTGTRLDTHYDVLGIHEDRLREYARNSIRDRGTPAIIGTGWLTHYPLAFGYAWRSRETQACFICPWTTTEYSRWFYVNQG
ncbi:MAG: hypothetical protein ACJ8CR_29615, partial [Roseiflexaceae bacterium]